MNMRIFGIVMLCCDPMEPGAEIAFHFFPQSTDQVLEIQPIAEFRGDDQLEQPPITSRLPFVQCPVDRNAIGRGPKSFLTTIFLMSCAFACDVSPVGLPLSGHL